MKLLVLLGLCALASTVAAGIGECNVCKLAFNVLEDKLRNNKTQAAIISELEQLCHHLPTSVEQECTQIVEKYGRTFINVIDTMSPTQFCDSVHLCQAKVLAAEPSKPTADTEECKVCETFLRYIRNQIGNKKTEQEIEADLEKVCTAMPEKLRAECTQFVTSRFDTIVKMLLNKLEPREVCQDIHLCQAAKILF